MIRRSEDLKVWQTARVLSRGVYRAAERQKLGRDFALGDQMKRAAVSVAGKIAEGFERGTRKQHIEFCYAARGSAGELRSRVTIAHDVGLLDERASKWLHEHREACSPMLSGYITSLERPSGDFPGLKTKDRKRAAAP